MKVRIKKIHKDAFIPQYSKKGDAGLDLTATSKEYDENGNVVYGTGLAFEIPEGYVGLLFPRSSNAKKDLLNTNSVGIIDSGYRGEVMMKYKPSVVITQYGESYEGTIEKEFNTDYMYVGTPDSEDYRDYNIGDRIGQLIIIPYPKIELEEVEELTETERGSGSYGSTGK